MVASGAPNKLVDPRDLLEMLRQQPMAQPFNLAFYSERQGRQGLSEAIHSVCAPLKQNIFCTSECYRDWIKNLHQARSQNRPVVSACPQGLLYFVIFLPQDRGLPDYLIGGGVFDRQALIHHETRVHATHRSEQSVGQPGLAPRFLNIQEAESSVKKMSHLLPKLLDLQVHELSLKRTTQRLEAVQKLNRDLKDCPDIDQSVALVSEALVVLFNLSRLLIVLQKPGQSMKIHATLGLDQGCFKFEPSNLNDYWDTLLESPAIVSGKELNEFFPGLDTRSAFLLPVGSKRSLLGLIAILDIDLHSRDQALIELLISSLASRLETLETEENHRLERQFSTRLISMISKLSLISGRKELFQKILDMSSDLLSATSGSLMLLDETDGSLKIETAKGMNASLAQSMTVSFGEGIAGRVAKNGFPLLVSDIEADQRVAFRNRPRFKTKSFISLPLEVDQRLIGVLNLADKNDGTSFSEADLNLLKTFTNHAVLMISRAAMLEQANQFEKMAITDPLTNLYNRRFLETRLQEEFSRSGRQHQSFCTVLADLDNFKIYNDICGHIAGDNVLRKAAQLMRRSARDMDVVARYGGEEFCIVLPATGKKEAVFVAERIRKAIEAETFPGENHLPLGRLTISIGIACFPADGVTANELLHAADMALYQAKAQGRNRLVLYESSLHEQSSPAAGE